LWSASLACPLMCLRAKRFLNLYAIFFELYILCQHAHY
jgi:hypothetical protein